MPRRPTETFTTALGGFFAFLVNVKAFWLMGSMDELAAKLQSRFAFVFLLRLITVLRIEFIAEMAAQFASYSYHAISIGRIQIGISQLRLGHEM